MKTLNRSHRIPALFLAVVVTTSAAMAEEKPAWRRNLDDASAYVATQWNETRQSDFYRQYILNRLELGVRHSHFELTDSKKRIYDDQGNFIGGFTRGISIDRIEAKQDYTPQLFARYYLHDYFGFEWGREKMIAKTYAYWDNHTDGNIVASGSSLLFTGRYPDHPVYRPYAALGFAFLDARFDHSTFFHTPDAAGTRTIRVDDAIGAILMTGCSAHFANRFSALLNVRYMWADIDAEYYIQRRDGRRTNRSEWTFPFDNWSVQAGIQYTF